ncbi:MAG TPA: malto-oligosyltrehalose synthase [Longimicrobiaceae bacterium]|nr:malto-oligosyltrehalose synthase [Longimicrobiaceae bacterium]
MSDETAAAPRAPLSTYRLQFNQHFTFRDATALVPYLERLGVDWLYASPYLEARPGSPHGYDISNHDRLNPEIGTAEEHARLSDALHERGMGQLLDIVPNHMGIGEAINPWWMDVLENGPSSEHAPFFDIDWAPLKPELAGKVLLPVLGDQFGRVLESGELVLEYHEGGFRVRYHEHIFPVAPRSRALVLGRVLEHLSETRAADDPERSELEIIVAALERLPPRDRTDPDSVAERGRESAVARRRVEALAQRSEEVRAALDAALREFNGTPGAAHSFDRLEALLDEQAYRLAYWRVAAEEINYRRFFDINTLAGIRVEEPEVFQATHRFVLSLLAEGRIDGLRVDHPDGLYDPPRYLRDLQRAAAEALRAPRAYVVVEKILTGDERLPETWPVAGTVGYEFLNRLNGLFVDPAAGQEMDRAYGAFIGRRIDYPELVYHRKKLILRVALASEVNVLAYLLARLSETNRCVRDFTLGVLTHALRETIACFPVYRTYIDAETGEVPEYDRQVVERAVRAAVRRNRATSRSVFEFLRDVLLLRWPGDLDEPARERHRRFVMKFQQLTGPVMAKGVEDTAFYVYDRLVSLNEVGGEPQRFGTTLGEFHSWVAERAGRWPLALNATSTHDTKRSEDVRARINVLSEMPGEWAERVGRWAELNRAHKGETEEGVAPDANDEYLLYQTLVGAWPLHPMHDAERAEFVRRIQQYMEKATREAKVHTSWIDPNDEYDDAVRDFVAALLDESVNPTFLTDFRELLSRVARPGVLNSLSQTLLKLACPGVPDIYQGQELLDFSLVDPDNRRPVDYAAREARLREIDRRLEEEGPAAVARDAETRWENGGGKLLVTRLLLRHRREHPELFRAGSYEPLAAGGSRADHVVAFARRYEEEALVVVAPRLWATLLRGAAAGGAVPWADTRLDTAPLPPGRYRNLLDGADYAAPGEVALAELLRDFPVAALERLG